MKRILGSSVFLLSGGNLLSAVIVFLRNILVARLVSVEDFGIAATLSIAATVIETSSNFGLERFIIQARDGNEPRFQTSLQTLQLARGVVASALLVAISMPYAWLMGVPDVAWAFQLLAIFPLLRGFMNLDLFRVQRFMQFKPQMLTMLTSQFIAMACIWPLFLVFGDYQIVLWSIIIQHGTYVIVSHIVSERRYRLSIDTDVFKRSFRFGAPILVNALLVFVIFNGDRIIVGNQLGTTILGWFSLAFTLTITPTLVATQTLQSYFLPKLSEVQDKHDAFTRLSWATIEAGLLVAVVQAIGFAVFGPAILILLFGEKYSSALSILTLLAIVQAIRFIKIGPVIIGIAKGETANPFLSNIVRILFLPLTFFALLWGADIVDVVWIAIAGETASLLVAIFRVRSQLRISMRGVLFPFMFAFVIFFAVLLDFSIWPPSAATSFNIHINQTILATLLILFPFSLRSLTKFFLPKWKPKP